MKISRTEGILAIETKKPYKMAIGGKEELKTEIICHDVNSKCEDAAFDLEQMIMLAMTNMPTKNINASKKQIIADEKKGKLFFEANSPTHEQIKEQSDALKFAVQVNTEVKMSEMLLTFMEFIKAGVVCCAGDQKIYTVIWESIDRHDKVDIMFRYCAFFVNPLEHLLAMDQ